MASSSLPPIETLKRLPKFLELLPRPWPGNLEANFGSLRGLEWDKWWEHAQHHFVRGAEPIPVQVISSDADYRLRDPEAEAVGDQVTVVINLWYSKKTIQEAIEALLNDRRDWPTGDTHEDWLCDDFVVRAYRQPKALDKIYDVMKLTIVDQLTVQQIADKTCDDESAVRKMKKKGERLLEKLKEQIFPVVV